MDGLWVPWCAEGAEVCCRFMTEENEAEPPARCHFCINTLCVAEGPIQILNQIKLDTHTNTHTQTTEVGMCFHSDNRTKVGSQRILGDVVRLHIIFPFLFPSVPLHELSVAL